MSGSLKKYKNSGGKNRKTHKCPSCWRDISKNVMKYPSGMLRKNKPSQAKKEKGKI
jgi:hypothetical protein